MICVKMARAARKEPRKKFLKRKEPRVENEKKARRKKRKQSFRLYILKVLRLIHPDLNVSKMAMSILNSFMNDMFERLASEASHLVVCKRSKTLSSGDIQASAKLLLTGELAQHAVTEGLKAVNKYYQSVK